MKNHYELSNIDQFPKKISPKKNPFGNVQKQKNKKHKCLENIRIKPTRYS